MALAKVNVSIAALMEETALSTVDKLVAFLGEKIEIDEDMQQMFADFKATLKVTPPPQVDAEKPKKKASKKAAAATSSDEEKPEKAKRAPSSYNMYLSAKIAELKAQGAKGNLMKLAIEAWKTSKGTEPALSQAVPEDAKSETNETEIEVTIAPEQPAPPPVTATKATKSSKKSKKTAPPPPPPPPAPKEDSDDEEEAPEAESDYE